MKLFQELGESVEKLWREENYDEEFFPAIAKKALEEANLPEQVSAWEVIDWTLNQTNLPEQKDLPGNFGDPPITLYNAPRFHVDVYFWLEGTTAIHQHAFCGAFQVLHGSSIHSWYEFETSERINTFTETGKMNLKLCEILEIGDVQEIFAGRQYIHSLFHLEQPSATIVVRTHKSPLYLPQYSYHKPSLATDPFFEEANTTKKIQAITALIRSKHPDTDRFITEFLDRSDFQTSFQILTTVRAYMQNDQMQQMFNLAAPKERFGKFLETVGNRHAKFADVLPKVFAYHDKLDQILRQRSYVTDAELRFFLALLLNIEGKERIFALIGSKFPEDKPLEKILDWVYKLANTKVLGMNIPNALGIADFDDFDLMVLEKLLEDRSDAETIDAIRAEMPDEDAENLSENIGRRIEKIRTAVIFEPLLK
jgi:hypothetical protein